MGVCNTKEKDDCLSISTYFKGSKKNNNINTQKSDFFNFTEWILGFQFYIKLQNNNDRITKLITKHLGSNEKNIFKVIKAIDQLEGKEFHEFTNSLSLQSSKSNNTKFYSNNNNININQTNINLNNMKNSENSNIKGISNNDLRLILGNFIDRLCINKSKKIQKILLIGPPNNIRWLMWFSIAKNKFFDIESQIGINNSQIYNNLINCSLNPEIDKKIREDLKNTLPNIKYFKNQNWLNSLYNILKVFSIYDKEIGYKKGMNDIVGNILIVSDCNEVESFQFLRYLFSNYYGLTIREFFKDDSIRFNFYTFLIKELIKERIFPIYDVINKLQIEKELWLDKWIITLYGILFDFSITIRLFDSMIALGLNFLINYTLGLLKYYQNVIVEFKDRNSFLNFFERKLKFKTDNDIFIYRERIIKLGLEFNISHATIKRIEDKFNLEMKMKNTNNMVYKTFQYSRLGVKNNTKENNHEIDIMKSIRRTINGSKDNYDSDKNYNNIENDNISNTIIKNNININGNKNNIKNNINSNIKNSFINNESKNDSESENSDNVINTNKKKSFNENIDNNEEENQLNLRKVFPFIKNNHLNFKTDRENNRYNNNKNKKGNEEIKNGNKSDDDIKNEENKKEESKKEENKKDEKKKEENKKEENKEEENKKDENKEEESKKEESKKKENKEEENKEEENKEEENKEEENKEEENKIEEIKKQEIQKEDIRNNDIKNEENKIEEMKKEEITIEENKKDEKIIKKNIEDDDDDSVIPIDNLDDDEDDINLSFEDENKPKKFKHLYESNT